MSSPVIRDSTLSAGYVHVSLTMITAFIMPFIMKKAINYLNDPCTGFHALSSGSVARFCRSIIVGICANIDLARLDDMFDPPS